MRNKIILIIIFFFSKTLFSQEIKMSFDIKYLLKSYKKKEILLNQKEIKRLKAIVLDIEKKRAIVDSTFFLIVESYSSKDEQKSSKCDYGYLRSKRVIEELISTYKFDRNKILFRDGYSKSELPPTGVYEVNIILVWYKGDFP